MRSRLVIISAIYCAFYIFSSIFLGQVVPEKQSIIFLNLFIHLAASISLSILSYQYAFSVQRRPIIWALGAFVFPFPIPLILCFLPSPNEAFTASKQATGEEIPSNKQEQKLLTYHNKKWDLSFDYPSDWEILWENEPDGGWEIIIGITGNLSHSGKPAVTVRVLQHAVLNFNSASVSVYAAGGHDPSVELPRTPEEYNERCKDELKNELPGLNFISENTGTLGGMPSGTLCYSYEGQNGTIWEKQINLFGITATYRLLCESPEEQVEYVEKYFDTFVEKFKSFAELEKEASEKLETDLSPFELFLNTKDKTTYKRVLKQINDQDILTELLDTVQVKEKIVLILRKLKNQAVIEKYAQEHHDNGVRIAAVKQLTNQDSLSQMALHDKINGVRIAAAARISDKVILKQIFQNDPHQIVRETAGKLLRKTQKENGRNKIHKEAIKRNGKMEKIILKQLLEGKPADTKNQVTEGFASVSCNYEFAVSVTISKMQQHMDTANQKGFIVWCNEDGKTAIIYGAGEIDQNNFTDCVTWLNDIRIHGDIAIVHFITKDGDKLIELEY